MLVILLAPIQVPANDDLRQAQLLTNVRVTFTGIGQSSYALDRSFGLTPAAWVTQFRHIAGASALPIFTNTPNKATNNF